jgi:hypothetical protein
MNVGKVCWSLFLVRADASSPQGCQPAAIMPSSENPL